jgi:ribosomal protein S18
MNVLISPPRNDYLDVPRLHLQALISCIHCRNAQQQPRLHSFLENWPCMHARFKTFLRLMQEVRHCPPEKHERGRNLTSDGLQTTLFCFLWFKRSELCSWCAGEALSAEQSNFAPFLELPNTWLQLIEYFKDPELLSEYVTSRCKTTEVSNSTPFFFSCRALQLDVCE